MPERTFTPTYRYNYQGQENAVNSKWQAFELRLHNSDLGRWMSPDPYGQFYSPYISMGNNPVSGVDPDGGFVNAITAGWYNAMGSQNYSNITAMIYGNPKVFYEGEYQSEWLVQQRIMGERTQNWVDATTYGVDGFVAEQSKPYISHGTFGMNQYDLKQMQKANGSFALSVNIHQLDGDNIYTTFGDNKGDESIVSSTADLYAEYQGSMEDYKNNSGNLRGIYYLGKDGHRNYISGQLSNRVHNGNNSENDLINTLLNGFQEYDPSTQTFGNAPGLIGNSSEKMNRMYAAGPNAIIASTVKKYNEYMKGVARGTIPFGTIVYRPTASPPSTSGIIRNNGTTLTVEVSSRMPYHTATSLMGDFYKMRDAGTLDFSRFTYFRYENGNGSLYGYFELHQ